MVAGAQQITFAVRRTIIALVVVALSVLRWRCHITAAGPPYKVHCWCHIMD